MSKTTVQVNIYDPYRAVLIKWASMRRTLEQAVSLCDLIVEGDAARLDAAVEQANHTVKELEGIIPALEHLHLQVREKLWVAESAPNAAVIWPYDSVNKRWAVVVAAAQKRGDKSIFVTDGATYIVGDIESFGSLLPENVKFKLGAVEVILVSIDGGARIRWIVRRESFEVSDKQAVGFFGLQ